MAHWFTKAPNEQLAGKTAIVMGGNSGIGKATAEQFAAAGANVVVAARREEKCKEVAAALVEEFGCKAIGVSADNTDLASCEAMIEKAIEEFGQIDILVTTAGVAIPRMNALEATEEDWDKIFAVNAKGNWFLATAAAKRMKDNPEGGKIVLVSSQRGISAMENIALYSTTKSTVMGMVRALAIDLAKFNIQVNGIAPGYVMTPMVEEVFANNPAQEAYVASRTPSHIKSGSLEEMAESIYFLCSPVTEYMTGQTIILDGGWSIQ